MVYKNKLLIIKSMQLGVESFCENLKIALVESEIPEDSNLTIEDFSTIVEDFCNSFIEKCNEVVETNVRLDRLYNHVIEYGDLRRTLNRNSSVITMLEAVTPHHDILSCKICRDYFDESF